MLTGCIDPATSSAALSKEVSVCGKAGSISIHHLRAIHDGSANRSGLDQRYFLMRYTAADSWPVMEKVDLSTWRANPVTGEETWTPRMQGLPVRLPLPEPANGGPIFENQHDLKSRYFEDAASYLHRGTSGCNSRRRGPRCRSLSRYRFAGVVGIAAHVTSLTRSGSRVSRATSVPRECSRT